tara:strand:+ start:110 stop:610 length:501 start_codon:yes stop_codon:yes gene_type:complete
MAISSTVKVRRDGTIKLTSGGGSPTSYTVAYEDGNFTANNLAEDADRIVIRDRGTIVGLRKGDDQVGSLSFSVHFREFTNATGGILLDFLNGSAGGSALTSIAGAGFEQFLLQAEIEIEGTDHGEGADPKAVFDKVLFTADFSEGDPDVLNVQGEVYGPITFVGAT